jgi:hypothetical protein
MKKFYDYENTRLKDDIADAKKIVSFDKRETLIYTGASIAGIACYGILKEKGFGDLESNYPLFAFYLASYLESLVAMKRFKAAKKRIEKLSIDIDGTQDEKVYDIIMDADIATTQMETMTGNNNYKLVEVDDVMHNGEVLVSQETTLERNGDKTTTTSEMSSDVKSLEKALK